MPSYVIIADVCASANAVLLLLGECGVPACVCQDVENCVWGFVASGLKSDAAAAIVSDLLSEAKNRLRYDKFEVAGLERMLWACENAAVSD